MYENIKKDGLIGSLQVILKSKIREIAMGIYGALHKQLQIKTRGKAMNSKFYSSNDKNVLS